VDPQTVAVLIRSAVKVRGAPDLLLDAFEQAVPLILAMLTAAVDSAAPSTIERAPMTPSRAQ
jgi:hypothetical protein